MNKQRRFKAKRRRDVGLWAHRWLWSGDWTERRRALLWLRAHAGLVWP